MLTIPCTGRRPATFSHEKLLWRLVQCCRRVHALGRSLQICLTRRCFTILHARGDNGAVVVVPERSHQCILQEACALAKVRSHYQSKQCVDLIHQDAMHCRSNFTCGTGCYGTVADPRYRCSARTATIWIAMCVAPFHSWRLCGARAARAA